MKQHGRHLRCPFWLLDMPQAHSCTKVRAPFGTGSTSTMQEEEDALTSQTPLLSNRKEGILPRNYDATTQAKRMFALRHQAGGGSRLIRRAGRRGVFSKVFSDKHLAEPSSNATVRAGNRGTSRRNDMELTPPIETVTTDDSAATRHSFLYSMLNPKSKKWQAVLFKRCITAVITVDLLFFVVSTDNRAAKNHATLFHIAEGIVSCIFLVEYMARLYVVPEKQKYSQYGVFLGRFYYAVFTFSAWIDFLATAPFFVELATGWHLPTLTFLRIFRLFRILKTASYIRAMDAVYRVVYYNSEILHVATLVCIFLTLVTAVLLYALRPENDAENDFQSIAATLYLSTLMLTGQGGPEGDLPWYTKLVVLLTSVFSVAMFAIPASMLTWGFEAEAERMAKNARKRAAAEPKSGDTSSSSSQGTTDDEYFKMIAGEEDTEDEAAAAEAPWMQKIRESFQNADTDDDGTLTLNEAMGLLTSGGGGGGHDPTMATRVESLEAAVQETNKKLDLILDLLAGKGKAIA